MIEKVFMNRRLKDLCPIFPIHVMKVLRLRLKDVEDLMMDPTFGENLKAIFLTRDPRGVMHSRSTVGWWCFGKQIFSE
jgi:hypothetical protein